MATSFFKKYLHKRKSQSLFYKANVAQQAGNLMEAEKYCREAIDLWQLDDPEVALEWNNLGTMYLFTGRLREGETAFQKSVDVLESSHWSQAPFWKCVVYNNFGKLLVEMKKWSDA